LGGRVHHGRGDRRVRRRPRPRAALLRAGGRAMSGMEQLYQQLILDHAKDPYGRGLQDGAAGESFQVTPTCGDEVRLRVHLGADGRTVERVSWEGQGCSISQASVSVMAGLVEG